MTPLIPTPRETPLPSDLPRWPLDTSGPIIPNGTQHVVSATGALPVVNVDHGPLVLIELNERPYVLAPALAEKIAAELVEGASQARALPKPLEG